MYHNGSDKDPKRGLSRRLILTSAILPGSAEPLPSELATSGYGYKIKNTSAPISNLFLYG